MKKHNESKSIKGIRHSKGRVLCKVIAFTIIFVMLFCISSYASEEIYTQNITVKTESGNLTTIPVNSVYIGYNPENIFSIVKEIESNIIFYPYIYGESIKLNGRGFIGYVETIGTILENKIYEIINYNEQEYLAFQNASEEDVPEGTILEYEIQNNDEIVTENITLQEAQEIAKSIYERQYTLKDKTDYTKYVTIETPPPAYEGFIGNTRGLFDMIFESMQSIFNWLVSPNVIVFFGLGIILSISTIGILIARRFFWGR